jgi:hypothetical protein
MMPVDVKAGLSKPAAAQKFAGVFIEAYLTPAFGARSKSEIDLLVFTWLIEAKVIDPPRPSTKSPARSISRQPVSAVCC